MVGGDDVTLVSFIAGGALAVEGGRGFVRGTSAFSVRFFCRISPCHRAVCETLAENPLNGFLRYETGLDAGGDAISDINQPSYIVGREAVQTERFVMIAAKKGKHAVCIQLLSSKGGRQKMVEDGGDVGTPLGQAGDPDQPKAGEQIRREAEGGGRRIDGEDETDIAVVKGRLSDSSGSSLFDDPEEASLNAFGQVVGFIEKENSPVCGFDETGSVVHAGEDTGAHTEQGSGRFLLRRKSRGVMGDQLERMRLGTQQSTDCPRRMLLSGTGRSREEKVAFGERRFLEVLDYFTQMKPPHESQWIGHHGIEDPICVDMKNKHGLPRTYNRGFRQSLSVTEPLAVEVGAVSAVEVLDKVTIGVFYDFEMGFREPFFFDGQVAFRFAPDDERWFDDATIDTCGQVRSMCDNQSRQRDLDAEWRAVFGRRTGFGRPFHNGIKYRIDIKIAIGSKRFVLQR